MLPAFLNNKPVWLRKHILNRMTSAIVPSDISATNDGNYTVRSETSDCIYKVHFGSAVSEPHCTCPDWANNRLPCKHMLAIIMVRDGLSWNTFPDHYRSNPFMTLDTTVLGHVTNKRVAPQNDGYMYAQPDVGNVGGLPGRKRSNRIKLVQQCTNVLKDITDLVYILRNENSLNTLLGDLNDLKVKVQAEVPSENGLMLNESPKKLQLVEVKKNEIDVDAQAVLAKIIKNANNTPTSQDEPNPKEGPLNILPTRKFGKPKGDSRMHYKNEDIAQTNIWVDIGEASLKQEDKESILNGSWLCDKIIDAAQVLISNEFPLIEGLRSVVLLSNGLYDCPVSGEALQAHHLGNHWVMSTSMGGTIKIYDSLGTNLSTPLRHQLVDIYKQYSVGLLGEISVNVLCAQKQFGSDDCGLFSIANMFAFASGIDPITVRFQQNRMREHLVQCLERKEVRMFPQFNTHVGSVTSFQYHLSKHCKCHRHKPGEQLIQCTSCHVRYHFNCLTIDPSDVAALINEEYVCPHC